MPPWRDPPPGRCCYVSLASKFPFSCYSKGPLRELPGAPQNDARAGVCSRPASASRGPSRGRAGAAPRRICAAPSTSLPRRRRVGPAPRPGGAPEPRRPGAVLGTRGRGHLPASTAPPARSVPLGIPTRRSADGEPLADKSLVFSCASRAPSAGRRARRTLSPPPKAFAASDVRIRPTAESDGALAVKIFWYFLHAPGAPRRAVSGRPARLDRGARITSRERRPRARREGTTTSPVSTTGRSRSAKGVFGHVAENAVPRSIFFSRD